MAVSEVALRDALAEVVGGQHLLADPGTLARAAVDGRAPRFVARPAAEGEVSRLLAVATAERLAVAPRGSGSSLALGAPPRRLDLVLDLGRLDAVTEHVPADMVVSVQAGATLGALGRHLAGHRQRLSLDPPAGAGRTIGGVLATNASGPLRQRYGTGRDLLLGVRFVQADGTVTWGGAKVVKSVTGYDVPKLLVGSLGTLGVIVEVTLRLHPEPAARGAWLVGFPDLRAARAFLDAVLGSALEPERLVLLDAPARRATGLPGAGPAVLVSIASDAEAVAAQADAAAAHARGAGGDMAPLPAGWPALDVGRDAPVLLKLAGEASRVTDWAARVAALAALGGMEAAVWAEAGNGVLHAALASGPGPRALADGLLGPLRDELAGEGGSLVVERCPAEHKGELDVWGPIPAGSLAIMARLKREFDPDGILNPGRFVGGL